MLQFGQKQPDLDYRARPTAFGLVLRDGKLACVRVDRGEGPYFDLPGGALDGDETEPQALAREFVEETGLTITPAERIAEASQYFVKTTGEAINNVAGFWTASVVKEDPAAKSEPDHMLVWIDPNEAAASLRHEAHAWAVLVWLRSQQARPGNS
jgi:8-oxo-dGTP diphosphatase